MIEFLKMVFEPLLLLKNNARSLIVFELICRGLSVFVIFPLLTWVQRLFLLFNSTSTIAAYNSLQFVLNPLTYVVLIVMALIITVFSMFERFALVDALHASKCGMKRSVRQIFRTGFDLTAQRFKPVNWGMIPYAIFILHFGTVTDISSVTSFIKIPGFILEDFDKHPWEKALFYAGIVVLFYFFLRWAFTIPLMMEDDERVFKTARRKSWEMTKGIYFLHVLFVSLFWTAMLFVLLMAVSVVIVFIWYLLFQWLLPGTEVNLITFFSKRLTPTSMVAYIGFSWASGPVILSGFQTVYYKRKVKLGEEIRPYTEEPDYIKYIPSVRFLTFFCIGLCIFISGPRVFAQMRWIMNTRYGLPLIMAHRGYSSKAPENTIPAFEKAIEEGFTAAELDVQMTKDGEIVVLHDNNLKRVTGLNKNIWDVTYDEIRSLDAGSHFNKAFAGTTIPTLAEVLILCKDSLYLNIEIKRNGHDEGIVQKTIDVIMEYGNLDNLDITSQDYATVEEVKRINSSILTAYTSIIGLGSIQNLEAADIISIQETFANYSNIANLHNAGKRVFVWTVNEEDTMEELIALNVDAILTNNPGLCKKVVDEYEGQALNLIKRIQNICVYM